MNHKRIEKRRKCGLCVPGLWKKSAHQMPACISSAMQQEDHIVHAAAEDTAPAYNTYGGNRGAGWETVDFSENKGLMKTV